MFSLMSSGAWFVLACLAAIVGWFAWTYNVLVGLRNRVGEAWSGIDVQLSRRHDLVPNLVETVRGYAAHERSTLEAIARARSQAVAVQDAAPPAVAQAETGLTGALGGVSALAEAYPDLRASESFRALASELSEIEDEISAARRIYNSNVQVYNTRAALFPNSIVAAAGGFRAREYFEVDVAANRATPAVAVA
jgi:LemA protein